MNIQEWEVEGFELAPPKHVRRPGVLTAECQEAQEAVRKLKEESGPTCNDLASADLYARFRNAYFGHIAPGSTAGHLNIGCGTCYAYMMSQHLGTEV